MVHCSVSPLVFYGTELQSRLDITFSWSTHTVQTHALLCLKNCFVFFLPTRHFLTHKETSPLPMKGFTFWPILGIHGHWAVRVLERAKPAVTRVNRLKWSLARTSETCCRTFGSGAVTACFNDLGLSRLGIEHRSPACEVNDLPLRHVLDPRGFF